MAYKLYPQPDQDEGHKGQGDDKRNEPPAKRQGVSTKDLKYDPKQHEYRIDNKMLFTDRGCRHAHKLPNFALMLTVGIKADILKQ